MSINKLNKTIYNRKKKVLTKHQYPPGARGLSFSDKVFNASKSAAAQLLTTIAFCDPIKELIRSCIQSFLSPLEFDL